eukprot:Platyproteum_vivax@DN3383_c0_g1_i1.p1
METTSTNSKNRQNNRKPKSYYTKYTYQKRGTTQTKHSENGKHSKGSVETVSFIPTPIVHHQANSKRQDKKRTMTKESTKEYIPSKQLTREFTRESSENTAVTDDTTPQYPYVPHWSFSELSYKDEEDKKDWKNETLQGTNWAERDDEYENNVVQASSKTSPSHSSFAQPDTIYYNDSFAPTMAATIVPPSKKVFTIKDPLTGQPLQLGPQQNSTPVPHFPPFAALLEFATNTPRDVAATDGYSEYAYQHELCEFMTRLNSQPLLSTQGSPQLYTWEFTKELMRYL